MKPLQLTVWTSFLAAWGLISVSGMAQDTQRERPEAWRALVYGGRFMDRFLPSPVRNPLTSGTWGVDAVKPRDVLIGIEEPDWSYWGGNIKQVGDAYHLFVCRWPEGHPKGHMAWPESEVVHAVAPHSWGPFKAVQVIGPGHNPEIYRARDGSYVLYVIGGYYHAPAIAGPWTRKTFSFNPRGRRIIEGLSNLSFAPREDGSVLMVCRGGGIWVSEDGLGPWQQVSNRRVYPDVEGAFEDPVIWRTGVQYHMIVNDWRGRIAWYLRSKDGFEWKVDPGEAYMPGIDRYEDGTNVDWYKYERLKLLQDDHGRPYQANFAVIDYSKWEDKPNDIHSSKNITIPLTVERLIAVLDADPIRQDTRAIRLKVMAEAGFDPGKDMDLGSLRFGTPDEVNFGRGCRVTGSRADGDDLILTFDGRGNGFTADHFAGKLLGRTPTGKLLFGYSRLPGVTYGDAFLSADLPRVHLENGRLQVRLDIKNVGLTASRAGELIVRFQAGNVDHAFSLPAPSLTPLQETTLTGFPPFELDPELAYQVKVTASWQKIPLFETEPHKKAPLLKVEAASPGPDGAPQNP
ncbi:MAG: hypothetical protein H7A46_00405 [Verrucomicrobiales bacterium]|nr:hypothetical protein [Verrucomicrobiales bacterium]